MAGRTSIKHNDLRLRWAMMAMAALVAAVVYIMSWPAHAAEGDAKAGEDVFRRCKACHAVGPGAKNRVGPMLNNLIGRKAASVPGYKYSPAMKAAGAKGVVWTEAVLQDYLTKPRTFLKGTKMIFNGLPEEEDRVDLLAYLKTFSKHASLL